MNSHPSEYFLEFTKKFPDSTSTLMWKKNLKLNIKDYGQFGNALYDGKIQEAFLFADFQNKKYLKQLEFVNSMVKGSLAV
jgi:hypothetical protein